MILDWNGVQFLPPRPPTTLEKIDAALALASGANAAIGQSVRDRLSAAGRHYDSLYADPAVDVAKTAWLTAAAAAHAQADHACRYVESLSGSPGPALTFNAYSSDAILARLEAVEGDGGAVIAAHIGAVKLAYLCPTTVEPPNPYTSAPFMFLAGANYPQEYRPARYDQIEKTPIRLQEIALLQLMAEATTLLAFLAYP